MNIKAAGILNNIFGYKNFRPLQEEVINTILDKNDSLVVMPTGGGKSLCYQIPALIFDGLTVVISPLISLMKDQVEQLHELGVDAVYLNSSLSAAQYRENINLLNEGKVKLLYVAPETLFQERTINLLTDLNVECITVDEAHCISEWGHDFRPEYRKIADIRGEFPNAVCVAFTATATPRVQKDINETLKLNSGNNFVASFNRDNLFLEINAKTNGTEQTIKFLRKYPNQSGIIYCFSRKQVDSLYNDLANSGYSVLPYHAGLSDKERQKNQELFIKDDVQIIVATIAFGMGINKSNVRFVIHYDLPKNIESYYQEIGRAGRDGLRSHCLMLFSYADTQKLRYFIDQKDAKERIIAERHLNALLDFAETGICRRIPLLEYFGEQYNIKKCGMCDNCSSNEKDLVDVTIAAQKFLSCVKRTNELFGASHIIDILRGSESLKVMSNGHDKLSTYAIGKEYTKKQWLYLSHQFIQQHLLDANNDFGNLKLTSKAVEVLKDNLKITGKIKEDYQAEEEKIVSEKYDHLLFATLRVKRKEIADELRLPPYVIFSDRTLTEMASFFPTTKSKMLRIHGLGEIKYEKYGVLFLNQIIEYCKNNNIKTVNDNLAPSENDIKKPKKKSHNSTGDKFNSGQSIMDIIQETKFKRSTILKHLLDFIEDNKLEEPDRLLEDSRLSEKEIEQVLIQFNKLGNEKLAPVYSALKEKISYDELQLLKIYHRSKLS